MRFSLAQKIASSVTLIALMFLFGGCPYSSSVPIDNGSVQVKSALDGKWIKSSDKDTENPTYFEFSKKDNTNADVIKYEFSSSDSTYETTLYHLTFSQVGNEVFMNALEDGGSSYYLFKFNFDENAGEITTYEVTDYIKETFDTSEQLKSFIEKNKDVSYFFTNSVDSYVRM